MLRRKAIQIGSDTKSGDYLNGRNFLRVPGAGDRLELVVFEPDVLQLVIRNVLDVNPIHIEFPLPLWIAPDAYDR